MQFWSSEEVGYGSTVLVRGTTRHHQLPGLSLQDFQKLQQNVGTENYSTWLLRNVCKRVSSRPTGLFGKLFWTDAICNLFPAASTQLISQSLPSHTLWSCLEIVSAINNICNFQHSNFQKVNTQALCSWADKLTEKENYWSLHNLCKRTISSPALSANTSIECNFYMSCSNYLLRSFRLDLNVGGFSKHQSETSDTDRHKG